MKKEEKPRRKRMRRDPEAAKKPWKYRPVDGLVLSYLARYRYLRGTFLQELSKPWGRSTVNYSLRKLLDHGYVAKPGQQEVGDETRRYRSWNDSDIYEITDTGFRLLGEKTPEATNLRRVRAEMPARTFKHSMMICDALASIEIGAVQSGCSLIPHTEIIKRVGDAKALRLPCTVVFRRPDGGTDRVKTTIIPDAIFAIRYPDGRSRLYLLEAEHQSPVSRTQINDSSSMRKMLAYSDVRKTGAIRQLGKKGFDVLFLYPLKSRVQHAAEISAQLFGQGPHFLFAYQAVQERSYTSPKPNPELFTGEWLRGGLPPVSIKEPPTA
jgi:hypothetical protein